MFAPPGKQSNKWAKTAINAVKINISVNTRNNAANIDRGDNSGEL